MKLLGEWGIELSDEQVYHVAGGSDMMDYKNLSLRAEVIKWFH